MSSRFTAAAKPFGLHFFADTFRRHPDQFLRAHVGHGDDEPAKLVHGKQRLANRPVERVVNLVPFRVRQDRPDDLFIDAAFAQNLRPLLRVVGDARPALVVEVVQQAGDAPLPGVLAQFGRVMPHRRLDRERVFQQ